jgi:hypothetical protein
VYPVEALDNWIERYNCRIEKSMHWFLKNNKQSEDLLIAVDILSDVVDVCNTPSNIYLDSTVVI